MMFGLLGAMFHFQFVVDKVLSADPGLMALKFFDNFTTHGNSWEYMWDQMLHALRLFAAAGFM